MKLVSYRCPTHGIIMEAPTHALVECRCGLDCAPEGVDPKAHRRAYFASRRQRLSSDLERAQAQRRRARERRLARAV